MQAITILKEQVIPTILTNKFLELILLPTEQCNFRCTYCYEDFSIGRMKRDTIEGVKNLILNRAAELEVLKISWFGGEPLVARDIVYEISQFSQELAAQNNIKYLGSMTTNGFSLSLNVMKKLIALGVSDFQISLDGPRETHNKTRQRINKSGSFDQIWENLLALKQSDLAFEITLRIHITPENYASLFTLIDDLKIHFAGDSRFKLFLKTIADLGGPLSKTFSTLKGHDKANAALALIEAIDHKIPIATLKKTAAPYVCYAAQANSFIIRADGSLAKCTVALNDKRNSIGKLLPNGTLEFEDGKLAPWLRGITSLDTKALECPLYGLPQ